MAELKTKPTERSVDEFLDGVPDEKKRQACRIVLDMMRKATGVEPKMWGDSIVGFGDVHYKYASGRQGDWFVSGFSPRKQELTLYLGYGLDHLADLLPQLGKHKTGKGCLYIKKMEDIDLGVLDEIIKRSTAAAQSA